MARRSRDGRRASCWSSRSTTTSRTPSSSRACGRRWPPRAPPSTASRPTTATSTTSSPAGRRSPERSPTRRCRSSTRRPTPSPSPRSCSDFLHRPPRRRGPGRAATVLAALHGRGLRRGLPAGGQEGQEGRAVVRRAVLASTATPKAPTATPSSPRCPASCACSIASCARLRPPRRHGARFDPRPGGRHRPHSAADAEPARSRRGVLGIAGYPPRERRSAQTCWSGRDGW